MRRQYWKHGFFTNIVDEWRTLNLYSSIPLNLFCWTSTILYLVFIFCSHLSFKRQQVWSQLKCHERKWNDTKINSTLRPITHYRFVSTNFWVFGILHHFCEVKKKSFFLGFWAFVFLGFPTKVSTVKMQKNKKNKKWCSLKQVLITF